MKKYLPSEFEPKWVEVWEKNQIYETSDDESKEKKYILDFFPYPSGEGLHVGHTKGYTATDIVSRYFRMKGLNVLHPMGWDAFGLPAENYAIKTGIHPKITTKNNISNIKSQMRRIGLSFDWSREIDTTDPKYYKWTQWIFLKLFEKGLAYETEAPINFCPSCKTGLANEEVVNGSCDRCGSKVVKKKLRQWVLRITEYANRLLEDLDGLDWPKPIKEMQTNWIGKSEGSVIKFKIEGKNDLYIEAFTTRVDTLFGATAIIIAPEHELIKKVTAKTQSKEVSDYIERVLNKSDLERTDLNREKTGVFTGSYATHPLTNEKIPIWVADYVLTSYGTGAVMFVPAHDQRDFEFAKEFKLPIKQVIKAGALINSGEFDGLDNEEAKIEITKKLQDQNLGNFKVSFKLRDWIFSRQRYWGEPIPIIHCDPPTGGCGLVPVPENQLPVLLPDVEKYEPTGTGESPLANIHDFVNTTCPKCGGPGKRETNTMPQWAGSCWYYLRFIDPSNDQIMVDPGKERFWMMVDWYVGGAEHAVLHLLYARFWHKVLYDFGVVSTKEPFKKLRNVGLVLAAGGVKMSKSKGNVVNPDSIIEEYGADTLRMYEAFMGPFENSIAWDPESINGVYRFLNRVWELILKPDAKNESDLTNVAINKLIKKVSKDIEEMKFNTAISSMMEFVNLTFHQGLTEGEKRVFLKLLAPFAPFITEELWNESGSIHQQSWPEYKEGILKEETFKLPVQVNGKIRDLLVLDKVMEDDEKSLGEKVMSSAKIQKFLKDKNIKKTIYIPGKIYSIVVEPN